MRHWRSLRVWIDCEDTEILKLADIFDNYMEILEKVFFPCVKSKVFNADEVKSLCCDINVLKTMTYKKLGKCLDTGENRTTFIYSPKFHKCFMHFPDFLLTWGFLSIANEEGIEATHRLVNEILATCVGLSDRQLWVAVLTRLRNKTNPAVNST